jgi:hypothetical protein
MSAESRSVEDYMRENGLAAETRLYRYSQREHLSPTGSAGDIEISANPDPSEAVVDVYGQGHVSLAVHIGPGLAFAETADNSWSSEERACVELRLGDAIALGSHIYPVESITTERVWYVTMPGGKLPIREV